MSLQVVIVCLDRVRLEGDPVPSSHLFNIPNSANPRHSLSLKHLIPVSPTSSDRYSLVDRNKLLAGGGIYIKPIIVKSSNRQVCSPHEELRSTTAIALKTREIVPEEVSKLQRHLDQRTCMLGKQY